MLIEEKLYRYATEMPSKIAVISGDITVTYKELWENSIIAASFLKQKLQLNPGDRIIIAANKNIEFIYTYFGAHLNHNICVPVDPEVNPLRLQRILSSAQPKICIGHINHAVMEFISFTEIRECKGKNSFSFPDENNIADLLYTTGTTGFPKGVALTFKNLIAATDNINRFIGNTCDDVELLALPVSHSFGLGRLRCVIDKGGTLVLLGSFASMKKFYGEIERCRITGFGMVPASWAYLKKMSGNRIGNYARQLKYIEIGSAFIPLEDKQILINLLPHTRICMHYGLTEASRSTFIEFHREKEHLQSIGKATPNVNILLADERGQELPDGQEGEICVKGKHVCSQYWGEDQEKFSSDFFNGYFRTGDWGYKDVDGYLYLKSRKKEIINVGGKKVNPLEVEEFLNGIKGISESACIGIPDPGGVLGEVVKAFVVCNDKNLSTDAIIRSMQTQIENYKIPVAIERVTEIPKTSSGKIQRLLLK
jgi:long-chain acyl-CoA synthetase